MWYLGFPAKFHFNSVDDVTAWGPRNSFSCFDSDAPNLNWGQPCLHNWNFKTCPKYFISADCSFRVSEYTFKIGCRCLRSHSQWQWGHTLFVNSVSSQNWKFCDSVCACLHGGPSRVLWPAKELNSSCRYPFKHVKVAAWSRAFLVICRDKAELLGKSTVALSPTVLTISATLC